MNKKLKHYLDALKIGKTIHYCERIERTKPGEVPDIRDMDIYMKYISEIDSVEIKENISVYPDNEFDTMIKIITWEEFLIHLQEIEDKDLNIKIIS